MQALGIIIALLIFCMALGISQLKRAEKGLEKAEDYCWYFIIRLSSKRIFIKKDNQV